MRTLVLILGLLLTGPAHSAEFVFGQDSIELQPGAELVEQIDRGAVSSHLIPQGALEKINRVLEPEQSVVVRGTKAVSIYYLPLERRTSEVASYYRERLASVGRMVFECGGRTCGSSSNWANRIFGHSILYGPEQYQYYFNVELPDEAGYLSVYIGERATRKIYLYFQYISLQD